MSCEICAFKGNATAYSQHVASEKHKLRVEVERLKRENSMLMELVSQYRKANGVSEDPITVQYLDDKRRIKHIFSTITCENYELLTCECDMDSPEVSKAKSVVSSSFRVGEGREYDVVFDDATRKITYKHLILG